MKKIGFVLFFAMIWGFSNAQSPQFSQFYASPLYLAPSFAGSDGDTRIMTNYRDQWPKIPGVYVTYSFAADHFVSKLNSGFGLFFMKDQAGQGKLNITNIAGNYNYRIKLNDRWFFRPGLKAMYYQNYINYNKIVFNDQLSFEGNNPTSVEIPEDNRSNYFDFGTSFLFYNDKYWVGASIDHLIKINSNFTNNTEYAPMKYSIFGGANIPIEQLNYQKKIHKLIAAFQVKSQAQSHQFSLGAYYQKNALMVGVWYRAIPFINNALSSDAIILLMGYTNSSLTIGYSYDMTISRLITYSGGAHELSFIYKFSANSLFGKTKHSAIPCPAF